jgi:hypothetical protein
LATVFDDAFGGSSADLDGRTPDTAGTSWAKNSFYPGGVIATISGGGRVRGNTASWQMYHASDDPGADDYAVEAVFYPATVALVYPLVMARMVTNDHTGYGVLYNKDTLAWELVRYNNTASSALGSFSQTLTPGQGYACKLTVAGVGATVSLEVFIDGVSRITASDTDALRLVARGRGGIANFGAATDSTGIHFDRFILTNGAAGDTTPPTLSSLAVPSAGTTLTATLSESGCVPASGTGGFTLGGTGATVASWAISGTTLTLTLSGTVYQGQAVTLSYDDATASDSIEDAAGNDLADISNAAVTNNSTQVAPVTSFYVIGFQ